MRPTDPKPGDYLTARFIRDLLHYCDRALFSVTYPLRLDQGTGGVATLSLEAAAGGGGVGIPARVSGPSAGGGYSWVGLRATTGGGWVDMSTTGVGAYEYANNTHVAVGTRVELLKQTDGSLRFQMAPCP